MRVTSTCLAQFARPQQTAPTGGRDVCTVLLTAVVDHLVALIIIVLPFILAIHVTIILTSDSNSASRAVRMSARPEQKSHQPPLGIRLVANEPADGENHIAVVAEHAAKLGVELAALSGLRDDRAAFASVDEDAESELVGARLCCDMLTKLFTAGNCLAFRLGASSCDRARRCSGLGDIQLSPQPAHS